MTTISIDETLLKQVETLAQQLNITRDALFEAAIETFIRNYPVQPTPAETDDRRLVVNQGDVYWVDGAELGIPHPHLVIQENVINHSRIDTVAACTLTSNLKRVSMPGNVLLDVGEANLPRQSVVEVSKVVTVDKARLGEYIGSLSEERIHQVLTGMRLVQASFFRGGF